MSEIVTTQNREQPNPFARASVFCVVVHLHLSSPASSSIITVSDALLSNICYPFAEKHKTLCSMHQKIRRIPRT